MHLEASRIDDFLGANTMNRQRISDQGTMTAPRHGSRTQQRDAIVRRLFDEGAQMSGEFRGLHVIGKPRKESFRQPMCKDPG